MAEAQKEKGSKGALIGMAVVIVVLVLSNIYTYMSLQNQISGALDEVVSLQNENAKLKNTIAQLNTQISQLQQIINLQKATTLDKDKTVNLPAGTSITLYYSTQYVGYIRVDFTASGPVYFRVGNSNYGYSVRYPESGTATSGSFIIPVLPGTTYLYIEHPAVLIGASITFTTTYVY
jgi:hypothetical protein